MKQTDELLRTIEKSHDLDGFLDKQEFIKVNISEYLNNLIEEKKLVKSEVIKRSGLDRVYAYQILNGTRTPSRDKLVQFAFGMRLDLEEVQKMLKYNGLAPLYPKNRRDSIIIFALNEKSTVIDLNIMLDNKKEKILE